MLFRKSMLALCLAFFTLLIQMGEGAIVPRMNNRSDKRPCDVAVAAIFQNEGPFLKEWIEYHLMIGVGHFYLYNNQSGDDFEQILKPYVKKGIVELFDVPVNLVDGKVYLEWQVAVYDHALKCSKRNNKWVAFIDIDEFICLTHAEELYSFLAQYEYAGGLAVNWVMYGTSGIYDLAPGELLIEKLVRRYPLDWGENRLVKSIVRPEFVDHCIDAHTFAYKGDIFAVHPNHQKFSHSAPFAVIPVDDIRINHYWYRTEKFFYEVKLPRRRKWGDGRTEAQIREQMDLANSIEDHVMDRFIEPLRKRCFTQTIKGP